MANLRIPDDAEKFLQESDVAITITCPRMDGHPIVAANEHFCSLSGYPADEILGRNCRFLQGEATTDASLEGIRNAIADDREGQALIRNYRKSGEAFDNFLFIFPILGGDLRTSFFIGSQFEIPESGWVPGLDKHVEQLAEGIGQINAMRKSSHRALIDTSKLASTTAKTILLSKISNLLP